MCHGQWPSGECPQPLTFQVLVAVGGACTLDPSEESSSRLSHIQSMNTRTAPPAPMRPMSQQRGSEPTAIAGGSLVAQLVKKSACNVGDLGSITVLGRSPGGGKGYPFQYSGLENSMDWIVHGVAKSRTRLSELHFHFSITQ